MQSKKILILLLLLLNLACAKERYVEDYPNVIPPIIENDHPEIFKIFKPKPKS